MAILTVLIHIIIAGTAIFGILAFVLLILGLLSLFQKQIEFW